MDKTRLIRWGIIVGVMLAAYFAHVEINTYLGKKVLKETGLTILSLEEAFAEARKENKQVLADLSAIWCPSCRKLDKNVLADADVKQAIADKYIYARIEYESDEGKAFQTRYKVKGFPNLLILDAQGNLVRKLALSFEPKPFLNQL